MKTSAWLKTLRGHLHRRVSRPSTCQRHIPQLVTLEDRTVPSTLPVPAAFSKMPLAFEANQGQTTSQFDFLARGSGYTLSLTASQAVLALRHRTDGELLSLQLVGADASARAVGRDELITKTNYLTGNDSSQWKTGIPRSEEHTSELQSLRHLV